jgi:tight adherence protein C
MIDFIITAIMLNTILSLYFFSKGKIYMFFLKIKENIIDLYEKSLYLNPSVSSFDTKKYKIGYKKLFETLLISPKYIKSLSKRSAIYFEFKSYILLCLVSSAIFLMVTVFFMFFINAKSSPPFILKILLCVFMSIIGFYFIHVILYSIIQNRMRKVDKKLPIFIDLIVICINAGLTIKQTFLVVSEEFEKIDPTIAKEFKKTYLDLSIFLNQKDAFIELLERIPSKKLKQFISIILINQEKGGSMLDTLSKTSVVIAEDYLHKIEEKSQKLPGILSALLTIFTLPMVLILVLMPHVKGLMGLFK